MDAAAALKLLEARLRVWPDEGDVIDLRNRLLELARLDTGSGSWVLTKEFHRLVDNIDRGAFCGTTRGDIGPNKELVGDMTAFIKDPFSSPKEMLGAFEEEYEVGINQEDVDEAKLKESEEPAEAKQQKEPAEVKRFEEQSEAKQPDEDPVIKNLLLGNMRLDQCLRPVQKLLAPKYAVFAVEPDLERTDKALEQINSVSATTTALVEFVRSGDEYLAILLWGKGQVRAVKLGAAKEIDDHVSVFLEDLRNLKKKGGDWLYEHVWQKVHRVAGSAVKHLLVSMDGALRNLPLVAVSQPGSDLFVLDLDVTVSYLAVGGDVAWLAIERSEEAAAEPATIVVRASEQGADKAVTGPPGAEAVVGQLTALAGRPPKVLEQVCAPASDAAPQARPGPILHLCYEPHELEKMQLKDTQLVMCMFGTSDPQQLSQKLQLARAESYVLMLLESDRKHSDDFVLHFYSNLKNELPVAAAMKAAQRQLRASGAPRIAWGCYATFGKTGPLKLVPQDLPWPMFIRSVANKSTETEKAASPGAQECLARESLVTAFLWKEAQKHRHEGIYVPVLKRAAGTKKHFVSGCISLFIEGTHDLNYRMPQDKVLDVIFALVCTLAAAERRGLVHGDLRPEQILWNKDGCPLVSGFGAAIDLWDWSADDPHKLVEDKAEREPWAVNSRWSAPEIWQAGHRELIASTRADIFSFAQVVKHYAGDDLPVGVVRVLDRCLQEAPQARYQSFEDVKRELQLERDALRHGEPAAPPDLPFPLPEQAPARQHAVVTELFTLVSNTQPVKQLEPEAVHRFRKLCHLLAKCHGVVGSNQAESSAKQALELAKKLHRGMLTAEAAESKLYLGLANLRRGKLADAEAELRESLRLQGFVAGEAQRPSPTASATPSARTQSVVAATWQALSSVLLRRGNLQVANESATAALRAWEALHGNKAHQGTAASLYHLGILLLERGQTQEARSKAERSREMAEKVYGERHRAPAASWHLLGSVLLKEGKPVEAEEAARTSYDIRRELHREQPHPDVAASLLLLGSVQDRGGKLDEAERSLQAALNMMLELRGTDADLEISSAYRRLGSLKFIRGRPEEALADMQSALQKSQEVHGNNAHPDTIAAFHTLGVLHYVGNRYQEAKECIKAAQDMQNRLHGPTAAEHPRTRDLANLMAEVKAAEEGRAEPPGVPGAPAAKPEAPAALAAAGPASAAPAPGKVAAPAQVPDTIPVSP